MPPRLITAGRLRYQISILSNPAYRGDRVGLYSRELHAKIQRQNVPESIVVYFDGKHSRTEEVNVDYGFSGPSFKLRRVGSKRVTYCKEFPYLRFCVEYEESERAGSPAADVRPTGETTTIAGIPGKKADYIGPQSLVIWYNDEIRVNDPTGSVLTLEGVSGLILQTEETPASETVESVNRMTLVEMDFDSPPQPELFSVPPQYRAFPTIDAAREENRRLLEEVLDQESVDDNSLVKFEGDWLFNTVNDSIKLEIRRSGPNEFRFRRTVLSAPPEVPGRILDERAALRGRTLIVEEPPNYRLYKLANSGQLLSQIGSRVFTFTREP